MIKGTYIFYENGEEIYRSQNVITKFGKRFLTNLVAGNIPNNLKNMAFGIDNASASEDDTRLGFEFYRQPISFGSADIQTSNNITSYTVIYKTTIPQDVVGEIYEIGLYPLTKFTANSYDSKFISDFSDNLVWADSNGVNPLVINSGYKIGGNVLSMQTTGNTEREYFCNIPVLDLSGYSVNDSIRLAFTETDSNLDQIAIRFYSSDVDYYQADILGQGAGSYISDTILLSTLFSGTTGSPNKSQIHKISIVIIPTSGNNTTVYLDGLRINDEDTFDPIFGLISRSKLNTPISKLAGRQIEVEYKLDLGF